MEYGSYSGSAVIVVRARDVNREPNTLFHVGERIDEGYEVVVAVKVTSGRDTFEAFNGFAVSTPWPLPRSQQTLTCLAMPSNMLVVSSSTTCPETVTSSRAASARSRSHSSTIAARAAA